MEADVVRSELVLPPVMPFKRVQTGDKYLKGQSRARYWKHLKQLLQAENFISLPPDEPNYLNIESPPSMYPPKKYCDITGFESLLDCWLGRFCKVNLADTTELGPDLVVYQYQT